MSDPIPFPLLHLGLSPSELQYIDEPTGIRLTVEWDIPEYPKLTVFPPEGHTLSIEEFNEAVRRLLSLSGRMPAEGQG